MNAKTSICALGLSVVALFFATPAMAAKTTDLFEMMDQLDKSDKQDFQAAIDKANACTRARDFPCSASELARAAKAANSGQDKKTLLASQNSLANEKQQLANEIRRAEEAARRVEEERLAQIRRDNEMEQARVRREEERQARQEWDEHLAREAEGRQSGPNVMADIQAALSANRAAAGRISDIHNNFVGSINAQARQRAELQEQQRRQQQAQQQHAQQQQQARQQEQRLQQLQQQQQTQRATEEQRQAALRQQAEQTAARNAQAARDRELRTAQQEQAAEQAKAQARAQSDMRTQLAQASGSGGRDNTAGGGRVAAGGGAATAKPSDPGEPDNDGCIEAIGWCSTAHTIETRGTNQILRFKNTCPFRVYGTFMNGSAGGKASSGADGVRAGGTHSWSTADGDGRSFIRIVGSTKASADWTCSGKFKNGGFMAGDSTLERR